MGISQCFENCKLVVGGHCASVVYGNYILCIIVLKRVCNGGYSNKIIEKLHDTHGHGDEFLVTGV